jgi:uncharacterized membrane protein (DUF485 family)
MNLFLLCAAYVLFVYYGFISQDVNSAPQGGARGMAIAIPIVLLIIILSTIFYTRKSGGDWQEVGHNIRHNLKAIIAFNSK